MEDPTRGTPPLPPRAGHVLRLAEIMWEVRGSGGLGSTALAEAILAHPGFSGCHDAPAALPAPEAGEMAELGEVTTTERGFELIEFFDCYDKPCSLQQSSLAIYQDPGTSAIWLGQGDDRMHLKEGQVKGLITHLQRWLDDGSFRTATLLQQQPTTTPPLPPAAPPAPEAGVEEAQRKAVLQAVAEALGNAYDCQRVWEAWSVGTMGQDDFTLTAEDDDRVAEIADAAIEAMRSAAPPAPESLPPDYIDPEHQGEDRKLLEAFQRAWWADGGRCVDRNMRGIWAVMALRPTVAAVRAADAAIADEALKAEFRAWWDTHAHILNHGSTVATHLAWGRHLLNRGGL